MAEQQQIVQPRIVKFGSEEHMEMLGLREANDNDAHQFEGYALVDVTQWGPLAREEYIQAQVELRVRELKTKPEVPGFAPKMWEPSLPPIEA